MIDHSTHTTVIAGDVQIRGEVTLGASSRIHGKIDGTIQASGEVTLGSESTCTADITAASVIVEGKVEGDISARQIIELRGSAVVKGDIAASAISIAEGATFSGQCRIGPGAGTRAEAGEARTAAPVRPSTSNIGASISTRPLRVTGTTAAAVGVGPGERKSDELMRDPDLARLLGQ